MLPKYLEVDRQVVAGALLPLGDDVYEVVRQHEGRALSLEAVPLLEVAQEVTEVYVE